MINRILSRVDFLTQTPEVSVSTTTELRVAFEPQDLQLSSRTTLTDECIIYTSNSGFRLRPTFIANDGDEGEGRVFKITFETKKNAIAGDYIGLLSTGTYFQEFVLVSIDKDYNTNRIVVYRDKEELRDIVTVFRDVSQLKNYASDSIQFIDGSNITPEELNWYYDILARPVKQSTVSWQGVKCPVVLLTSNEDDTHLTKIQRPYVHFSVNVDQPLEDETLLIIETKLNVYSIHCNIPPNCTSIGMPAVSNNSGLIIKFTSSYDRLMYMEILAIDYPFRTSLSSASPSTGVSDDVFLPLNAIPLPDIEPLDDFFESNLDLVPDDIIESCIRVHAKQWIEGEMEEFPPNVKATVTSKDINFQGLQKFSLHYGTTASRLGRILTDNKSLLILQDIWSPAVMLKEKTKYRLQVAYVFDGRPHKYKLKFKTSNIHGEPISYLFELPGPLDMHLVLTDNNDAYSIDSVVLDTLKPAPPVDEDDDEEWAALA